MRIGIDIRAIGRQRTGDETYTRDLVKSILKIDKQNQYFLYTNTEDPEIVEEIKAKLEIDNNSNAKIISILPATKALWTFWALPRYLAKNPVDVLHVQYITPLFLPKSVKLVTTIHDISFNFFPQYISRKDIYFLKNLIPLSLKRADKIIGVSDFTKREIEKFYQINPEKVVAVNNGVGEEFFEKVDKQKLDQIKKSYQLPDKFVLYIGTLQPRKNISFLIKGFAKLKKQHADNPEIQKLNLVIGGNKNAHNFDKRIDEEMEILKEHDPEIAREIHFPGFIAKDDLVGLYQLADIFCLPSLYEGFGIPPIEAMASGIPTLCSASSCMPEIVADAGMTYQEDSLADLVDKLYQLATNKQLKENLITKGYQRSREFSWKKCALETLAVYKSLEK